MSDRDDYYYYDGGMVSDSAIRKQKRSRKTKLPRFRPIVKRRVPSTEFGSTMGNLTMGMLVIFPVIALLTMAYPMAIFSIIGMIFVLTWIFSQDFKFALIVLGISVTPVLLGFVSLGFYMMLFG